MKHIRTVQSIILCGLCVCSTIGFSETIQASAPQRVSVTVYDLGFGLINEMRRVNMPAGESKILFDHIPTGIDPSTVSYSSLAGGGEMQLKEQRFINDMENQHILFQRMMGETIRVKQAGVETEGILVALQYADEKNNKDGSLILQTQKKDLLSLPVQHIDEITFPSGGASSLMLQPALQWDVSAKTEGLKTLRLNYLTRGLGWSASYEMMLDENELSARFNLHVEVDNQSGYTYDNARIRLVSTERGMMNVKQQNDGRIFSKNSVQDIVLRYGYGRNEPVMEQMVVSASHMHTFTMPVMIDLETDQKTYVQVALVDDLPISKFYVYDGVKFDRFQRNRRNDWNYGTESHSVVETHLQFENASSTGLGIDLPPGIVRLYKAYDDDTVDLIGENVIGYVAPDTSASVMFGPARGLSGERIRTRYGEVVPLHEYEESFEIRLHNQTAEEVQVRVVEHLYRWGNYEIVKTDMEYEETVPQTIEFRPLVKAGGTRSLHYTVRYKW